jgi:hypothetical protein
VPTANTYAYHRPSQAAEKEILAVRDEYGKLHALLEKVVPESPERVQALTRLKESSMWAVNALIVADIEKTPTV